MTDAFSVALFGSTVRKTTDEFSDCDLLIVTENTEDFNMEVLEKYTLDDRYSISFYNYDKLIFMANEGSLFIQHLKNESSIIEDSDKRLKKILSNFKPKNSYNQDIKFTLEYIKTFDTYPNSNEGMNWLCDCIFVGVRNYLIFKNAEMQIYKFSYPELINDLIHKGVINYKERNILVKLREIKQQYRHRIQYKNSISFIEELRPILSKLGIDLDMKPTSIEEFEKSAEQFILNKEIKKYYEKLRLFEGIYRGKGLNIISIENIVCNPQFYRPKFKNQKYVENLLKYLR